MEIFFSTYKQTNHSSAGQQQTQLFCIVLLYYTLKSTTVMLTIVWWAVRVNILTATLLNTPTEIYTSDRHFSCCWVFCTSEDPRRPAICFFDGVDITACLLCFSFSCGFWLRSQHRCSKKSNNGDLLYFSARRGWSQMNVSPPHLKSC